MPSLNISRSLGGGCGPLCVLVALVRGHSNRVSRGFLGGVVGVENGRGDVFAEVEADGQEKTND